MANDTYDVQEAAKYSESKDEDYNVHPITITYLNECFQIEELNVESKPVQFSISDSESEGYNEIINANVSRVSPLPTNNQDDTNKSNR